MKKNLRVSLLVAAFVATANLASGEKTKGTGGSNAPTTTVGSPKGIAADCAPPASSIELDLNNVRTLIHTGGDMWWDLQSVPQYEVPKGSGKHSLFAGSLWMGGVDVNNQLKVAAVRFRQVGYDFWPGPLSTITAEIDPTTCAEYDKFFPITRTEVDQYVAYHLSESPEEEYPGYVVPNSILDWPAHGNIAAGQDYNLAPYFDANGNGEYDPITIADPTSAGADYPFYDLNPSDFDCLSEREVKLFGDETLWWVFNDKGNIHTETGANPIGMEIRGQAFAFSTNDEINDMTFYNYELINRGSFTLENTYFAQWVDADLGFAEDDFVGCDVQRGLGYCYNGLAVDGTGGPTQYGENPPAIGVDFFQGPYQDNDNVDNLLYTNCEVVLAESEGGIVYPGIGIGYGDGVVDNERFGMRRFVYHNNTGGGGNPAQTDPQTGADYYNYMRGIWLDGAEMCYGVNGHPSSGCDVGRPAGYMFPGDTDPCGWGTGGDPQDEWTEQTAGNVPFDRRFMQSAGPFTLEPGAINDITVGVVWARANDASDPFASVEKVRVIDDKAQALFDNCFVLIDGPDAPELSIIELDQQLVLTLVNPPSSNNSNEDYAAVDPFIVSETGEEIDNVYRFEGYQIFQLKDETVSSSELTNPDVARLVAQCDIENTDPLTGSPIAQLINFSFSEELNASIPTEMVNGANDGLRHSFQITQDLFASGNSELVNHRKYYYMAISYAYNNFKPFDPNDPLSLDGQKLPYLAGRKNAFGGAIAPVVAIPHITAPERGGLVLSANYGDGFRLTRIEGQGNGGRDLLLTTESRLDILNSPDGRVEEITYEAGRGPVDIKVVDPKNLPNAEFVFRMHDTIDTPNNMDELADAYWSLECVNGDCPEIAGETIVFAKKPIGLNNGNEQLIPEWGISVFLEQTIEPGDEDEGNGLIASRISFSRPRFWLTGISDVDGPTPLNWIRSGTQEGPPASVEDENGDENQVYETVLGGTWAPWKLASSADSVMSPTWNRFRSLNAFEDLSSVDVIITSDTSRWTRCAVLEIADDFVPSIGNDGRPVPPGDLDKPDRFDLRRSLSVDKEGNPDGSGTRGMGWFPGFAINLETGERLNMAFGENSWLEQSNGTDMIWNPTSEIFAGQFDPDLLSPTPGNPIFGGGHYIYVFGHNDDDPDDDVPSYDSGQFIFNKLSENDYNPGNSSKRNVFKDAMWVGLPLLAQNFRLLENRVTTQVRVTKPFRQNFAPGWSVLEPQNDNLPMYTFSTADFSTVVNDQETAESALDFIRAVPNPYYANSGYERNQLENIIRITNLPKVCTISIYTVNGVLVRQITKDSPITSVDWDLNNHKGIPVASGLYLIHVDAPGIGEKVIKWFGTIRQIDLNSF